MNLLPFLYAFLAALTGLSPMGVVEDPRASTTVVERRVAVVAARMIPVRPGRAFEALRGPPAPIAASARDFTLAYLPAAERPARRRE